MFGLFRKRPKPPRGPTRTLRGPDWEVLLDLAPQVLHLSAPVETSPREEGEAALAPVPEGGREFASAALLALKAKHVDDGLVASVELARQLEKGSLPRRLAGTAPFLAAAARLGGDPAPCDPAAQRELDEFLADELRSKPVGIYTWNDDLGRVFRQDRMMMRPLDRDLAETVAGALRSDPESLSLYGRHLDLAARLTNPLVTPDLRSGGTWFFPPSRSHESDLAKKLFGDREIPEGFVLADELVRRIRSGDLSLAPRPDSGWYDHQAWALEPLAAPERMPEAARLELDAGYRNHLEQLFKAIVALTRETHVKQLEIPRAGCAPPGKEIVVEVEPELTVEPLVSYYSRRADAYRFLRGVLEQALGSTTSLPAVRRDGPTGRSLDQELRDAERLFRGAAQTAARELGLAAETADADAFAAWAASGDPDLSRDARMMVPVFHDVRRGRTKVWAVLGWAARPIEASFARPPAADVVRGRRVRVTFGSIRKRADYPVFAEVFVGRVLDRDEFRRHCDRHRTRSEILRGLG